MRPLPALVAVACLGIALGAKAPPKTTYVSNVAPILNRRCVGCHRPGEVGPFSLVGYVNAKHWATMIARVTASGQMPPWKAAHGVGEFQGDASLSEGEKRLIADWAAAGAPRGKGPEPPAALPKAGWRLGPPDLVFRPSRPFRVKADGPAYVYRHFVYHNESDKPLWVNGIDVHPGNPKVVHHAVAYLDAKRIARTIEIRNRDGQPGYATDGATAGFVATGALGGWAPGVTAWRTPAGTAFVIPPKTDIVVQVHYQRMGDDEDDRTEFGLYLAKRAPERPLELLWEWNYGFVIPPGSRAYRVQQTYEWPQDSTLYAVMPHMHLLGQSMVAWLEFPDGTRRPLVSIPKWDFAWQLIYYLKTPIRVPKGTKEIVQAIYDNSEDNPLQPNHPPVAVHHGGATTDEMFLLITAYAKDPPRHP